LPAVTPGGDDGPRSELWLATPQAARLLDPTRLDPADRLAWSSIHTARRRLDWASSRALQQALPEDARAEWNSSLSHSHGYAALARTSGDASIGVDLEWLVPRDFLSMASMAFTVEEVRELESLGEPAKVCASFYEYWTLKEAFAKALKLPLADALSRCCFAGSGSTAAALLPTARHWRAVVYAPRPRLRLAVVVAGPSAHSAAANPIALEWPPQREADWPVVRILEGAGTSSRAPC